ncbi:P-loop containing nucleoside triphosphate hydrolase protein, partial [Lipomyces kononenkoae]
MSKTTVIALHEEFSTRRQGIGFFHGDLASAVKEQVLNSWMTGTYKLLFTTSGFGVGIDYDSVTLVIHNEGIWSLVDFVQESGRAGRNNKPAKSIVLLETNWHPNYQKLIAGDAQVIDEYLSPNCFCRRYTIGQYMDGAGFTCLTNTSRVELCDICVATKQLLTSSPGSQENIRELQYPEGPIPVAKRVKVDNIRVMSDNIEDAFGIIIREFRNCVLCAITLQHIHHSHYDALALLIDHGIQTTTYILFNAHLGFKRDGLCHGCGFNLRIVNRQSEHVPGTGCLYNSITRVLCYESFINGRLSASLTDMDPGSLDRRDIRTFSRWL